MKICVCSDSHGNWCGLQEMIDLEKPNMICFLGDGDNDWMKVDVPQTTMFNGVSGNCDFMSPEPPFRRFALCGKRIFMTHGHHYGVKQSPYGLLQTLSDHPADLILYGHTHQARLEEIGGCVLLNPGAMIDRKYAIVRLDRETDEIQAHLKTL